MAKIALIGAGSAMFGYGALGDIFKSRLLSGSTVSLHDINPDALRSVAANAREYVERRGLDFSIEECLSRAEALRGADFCLISIEVGDRYGLWETDWTLPLKFGSTQVYGENGGPGGLFHALRIIPPIIEICDDIMRICPDALVFNLSNPMTKICTAIKRRHPHMKLVGICHEVASLPEHLPEILQVPLDELDFKAGGLNHFSVLLDVRYAKSGKDAYPDLRKAAPAYFAGMGERGVFMEILKRFGYLPITTDSHFGEYLSWAHDVADHEGILAFYTNYKKTCLETQVSADRLATGTDASEYWRVVPIIEALLSGIESSELAVNIPNGGSIDNLPADMIVEVPAKIRRGAIEGVKLGPLPIGIAGLLQNQVAINTLAAEAALSASKEIAMQALLVEPTVSSVGKMEKLLDTVIKLERPYLDYLR